MALKLRQGLAADRTSITPATGELIYTTDTKFVYVGDGTTPGGNLISGAVATDLNGLSDVVITSASNGQVLKFNGTNWINDTVAGGSTNLDGLTDVVITSASNGQVLKFNGTNWVNAAESSGSSFSVSGDDSSPRVINSGGTLSVLGDGLTNVFFDEYDNLTVQTNNPVAPGVAGQLAFYADTGEQLEGTGIGLLYDITTGTVFAGRVDTSSITTSEANFGIFNTTGYNLVSLGGTLDGTEYSGRLYSVDIGPFDPAAPFQAVFNQTHDDVNAHGIMLQRSRGTLASQAVVQAGDFIHGIFFTAYDGTQQVRTSTIAAYVAGTPAPGVVPGGLAFDTQNELGVPTLAALFDQDQYLQLYGSLKYSVQSVDTSSGNATLTRQQLRASIIFSTPAVTTRTLTLPDPDGTIAGVRLLIINSSSTQSLNISYTTGAVFKTIAAGNYADVVCEGNIWFSLN